MAHVDAAHEWWCFVGMGNQPLGPAREDTSPPINHELTFDSEVHVSEAMIDTHRRHQTE